MESPWQRAASGGPFGSGACEEIRQICLRFCLQNNVLPLPKSSAPERMKANLDIFDFEIEQEDIYRLLTMPQTGWSGLHPEHFE